MQHSNFFFMFDITELEKKSLVSKIQGDSEPMVLIVLFEMTCKFLP